MGQVVNSRGMIALQRGQRFVSFVPRSQFVTRSKIAIAQFYASRAHRTSVSRVRMTAGGRSQERRPSGFTFVPAGMPGNPEVAQPQPPQLCAG